VLRHRSIHGVSSSSLDMPLTHTEKKQHFKQTAIDERNQNENFLPKSAFNAIHCT
jgi:hypothetical protein